MIKKYIGSLALLAISLSGMLCCEGPSAAEMRKVINDQVEQAKAGVEAEFVGKQSKMLRDSVLFGSVASVCCLNIFDTTLKIVKGDISASDIARTVIGGVPTCLCGVIGVTRFLHMYSLSAEKQAKLDQIDAQAQEIKRELNKQIRQERDEAARAASEKTKQPTNTPVDSDVEDTASPAALVTEITAAADSGTKS